MPSSRSRSEKRGVSLTASAIARVDIGPGTFSASRIPSAKTQRSPESASTAAWRWMFPVYSTMVVVPVRRASSAATCTMRLPSSPSRRLAGEIARFAVFGKPKSSLKPRAMTARMWA